MVKRFENGKKYKFTKDAYIKTMVEIGYEFEYDPQDENAWWNICDGVQLTEISDDETGRICNFVIVSRWCEEVEDGES